MAAFSTPDITASLLTVQQAQQKRLAAAEKVVPQEQLATLKNKAREFESFYIYQVMELMTPKMDTEFDGGVGEEMFRHTLNEHMADSVTKQGGFDISEIVYAELVTQQEKRISAQNAAAAAAAYTQ